MDGDGRGAGVIVCGWCGQDTRPGACGTCGRDPAVPWLQRAQEPPVVDEAAKHRRQLAEAAKAIESEGLRPTIDRLAEQLDVSPRTVRRWREMAP